MTALLTCWVVLACIPIGTSITCYSCNSNYLPQSTLALNCNDTLKPEGIATCEDKSCGKHMFNCTGTDDECRQLYSSRRGTFVRRYCFEEATAWDTCNTTVLDKAIQVICLCNSDKCNDNPKTRLPTNTTRPPMNKTCNMKPFIELIFAMIVVTALFELAKRDTSIFNN